MFSIILLSFTTQFPDHASFILRETSILGEGSEAEWADLFIYIFLSVLLPAHFEGFSVSRMRDFFIDLDTIILVL